MWPEMQYLKKNAGKQFLHAANEHGDDAEMNHDLRIRLVMLHHEVF